MGFGERKTGDKWGTTAACVLFFLVCIWIAHPVLEGPYSDDFSYIFTTKRAAETGRLIYNGWACPMLGYQVYLGALFIKLFGFSFTAVRAAVMLIATVNVAVLHRLFLRLGRNWNAVIATMCVALGPVAFVHSLVFFTDVPGEFAFVVALFCCVRAMQAEDAAETHRWLVWCVVLNLALGSVRQTAWLGSLVLLPAVGWRLRRRAGVLRLTVLLWVVSAAVVGAALLWLAHAPYAPHESLRTPLSRGWLLTSPILPFLALVELLPLLFTVTGIRVAGRNLSLVWRSALFAVAATVLASMLPARVPQQAMQLVLHAVPDSSRTIVLAYVFVTIFLAAMAVQEAMQTLDATEHEVQDGVSFRGLVSVLWPYVLVAGGLVVTREGAWARYILPLPPAPAMLLIRLHAERSRGARFPAAAFAAAVVSVAVGVAIAHDDMLMHLPAMRLQSQYLAMGLPRNQLEAGMERDGWYELSTGHHINEPRITVPADAYTPRPLTDEQRACHTYFLSFAPEIHPVYVISQWSSPCYEQPALAMESQRFWLRPTVVEFLYRYKPYAQIP